MAVLREERTERAKEAAANSGVKAIPVRCFT
jgi:hypothetical protein